MEGKRRHRAGAWQWGFHGTVKKYWSNSSHLTLRDGTGGGVEPRSECSMGVRLPVATKLNKNGVLFILKLPSE